MEWRNVKIVVVVVCLALVTFFYYVTLHKSWFYSGYLATVVNATLRLNIEGRPNCISYKLKMCRSVLFMPLCLCTESIMFWDCAVCDSV